MEIFLYLYIFVVCLFISSVSVYAYNQIKKRRQAQNLFEAEQRRIAIERQKAKELETCQQLQEREQKYGKLTKNISLNPNNKIGEIAVYGDAKIICINNKAYPFSDIVSCDLNIKSKTIKGKETVIYTTPSDWDKSKYKAEHWLSGKKLVGETVIHRQPDVQQQECTLYISVNDLSNPLISIECGGQVDKANEINAILKVIISQNPQ